MSDLVKSLERTATNFILDPANHDLLTLVKGVRNGMVYGAKVRFPHALVMVFLFRSGTFRQKVLAVLKATRQHARNLATFAFIYKGTLLLLRRSSTDGKVRSLDPFIAGSLGGYYVFGRHKNSISQQIVIYIFARVALATAKLLIKPRTETGGGWNIVGSPSTREAVQKNAWPVFASLSWASVMWLYMWHPDTVQPSLRNSMQYIYTDSDTWNSLRNFVWHNK